MPQRSFSRLAALQMRPCCRFLSRQTQRGTFHYELVMMWIILLSHGTEGAGGGELSERRTCHKVKRCCGRTAVERSGCAALPHTLAPPIPFFRWQTAGPVASLCCGGGGRCESRITKTRNKTDPQGPFSSKRNGAMVLVGSLLVLVVGKGGVDSR